MEKLIRDKIPEMVAAKGETMTTRIAEAHELRDFLLDKILEEAEEVRGAQSLKELAEELADLLTVIKGIGDHLNIEDKIFEAAEKKYEERGGFEKGIILIKENI